MIENFQSSYFDSSQLIKMGIGKVGSNVLISEHATIIGIENLFLEDNIRIDSHVVILAKQGFLKVGSNVHIEPLSSLVAHNNIEIGNFCTISHGVRMFTASANYDGNFFTNKFPSEEHQSPIKGSIVLKDHVIVGANSVVMPNVVCNEGSAIGALSFVKNSIPEWQIFGGNPLRFIANRDKHIKALGASLI